MKTAFFAILAALGQAASPPVPAPAPVVNEAAAPVPAERIAEAEKLVALLGLEAQYDAIFAQLLPQMTQLIFNSIKDNATVDARLRSKLAEPETLAGAQKLFTAEAAKRFKARYGDLKHATAIEYGRAFTVDELKGLTAFYATPLGQKALSTIPQLTQRLGPIGAAIGQKIGYEAMLATLQQLDLDLAPPKA